MTIRGIPRSDGQAGTVNFVMGTEASSQGNSLDQRTFEITDNFTIPVGTHSFTFGVKDQFYKPINLFAQNSLGSWTFNDLDSLQQRHCVELLGERSGSRPIRRRVSRRSTRACSRCTRRMTGR